LAGKKTFDPALKPPQGLAQQSPNMLLPGAPPQTKPVVPAPTPVEQIPPELAAKMAELKSVAQTAYAGERAGNEHYEAVVHPRPYDPGAADQVSIKIKKSGKIVIMGDPDIPVFLFVPSIFKNHSDDEMMTAQGKHNYAWALAAQYVRSVDGRAMPHTGLHTWQECVNLAHELRNFGALAVMQAYAVHYGDLPEWEEVKKNSPESGVS